MDNYSRLLQLKADLDSAPDRTRQQLLPLVKKPKSNLDVYSELALEDPNLAAIAMIETSGGTDPRPHDIDLNSGMTAGGMFGMMPGTASDVVRLDKSIAQKYPEIVEYTKDLKNFHPKITEFFNNNPEAALEFAKSQYARAKKRLGDDESVAYSWLNGITGALKTRKENPDTIKNHDYVQKFRKYRNPNKISKK